MENLWAPWRLEYILNSVDKEEECIFCAKPKQTDDQGNLIIHRSQHCFVILNKYPYNNGHLMIVPYAHESDFLKLEDEILLDIQRTIKKIMAVMQKVLNPHGMNLGVNIGRVGGAGIDKHLHYHIVPRWNGDTNFMPVIAGTKVVSEALERTWEKLTQALAESETK
jgi:ATP adenylyltransferase